jgi:hypothetical protein
VTPGELRKSRLQRNRSALEDALIKLHEAADLLQPLSLTTGWPGAYPLSERCGRLTRGVRDEVLLRAAELRILMGALATELGDKDKGSQEGGGR